MYYEGKKFDGSLPIIGVNTFLAENAEAEEEFTVELIRSTDEEKEAQINSLAELHAYHAAEAPEALKTLQETARSGGNVLRLFLMRKGSLSWSDDRSSYEVGGRYRRNL